MDPARAGRLLIAARDIGLAAVAATWRDIVALAGVACVTWGLWDIYPPVAKIAAGLAAVGLVVMVGRRS